MINIPYLMPNINSTLINKLRQEAENSTLQQHLAAAVINNNKKLSSSVCNIDRNLCRGHYTPSLHAEARALLSFYGKNISYNKFKGWYFYNKNIEKKVDIAVVRVTRNGTFANARPCRKCLSMMRDLGIKRVHYTTGLDDELICENVKDMFSIQDSSAGKLFARRLQNYPKNDNDYYKYILKKSAPTKIKLHNLLYFIKFNLEELLPNCKYSYINKKGNKYCKIYDNGDFNIAILIL